MVDGHINIALLIRLLLLWNSDAAKDFRTWSGDTEEEEKQGNGDGGVNAVFNGSEESDDDGDNENEEFKGIDAPKVLPDARAGDQIQHRMNDNCREGCSWNIVEGGCQGVQGEDDDHSGVDTGERGAHPRPGLDGRTGEGAGGGIGTKEGADDVGNTDGDDFLIWIDCRTLRINNGFWKLIDGKSFKSIELHTLVVINSSKGLGDCHVFHDHQQHDDGQVPGYIAE